MSGTDSADGGEYLRIFDDRGYFGYIQATGIGGGRGYFWYTPPGRKFFENTPPSGDFGSSRHFVF